MKSSIEVQKQTTGTPEEAKEPVKPLLGKKDWHEEVERAVEDGGPLSVLIIDINNFKEINDSLGHNKGDEVIEEIGKLLAEKLRVEMKPGYEERDLDILAETEQKEYPSLDIETENELIDPTGGHIGGDEFAILVHEGEEAAQIITSRLREAFAEYINRPENKALKDLELGLSIGMSTLEDGMSYSDLLEKADVAMYEDKLSQLPELTDHQKRALKSAIFILESNGIRRRDFAKYLRLNLHT